MRVIRIHLLSGFYRSWASHTLFHWVGSVSPKGGERVQHYGNVSPRCFLPCHRNVSCERHGEFAEDDILRHCNNTEVA